MAFVCIGLILQYCSIFLSMIKFENMNLKNQLRQAQEMQRLQANYYMQLEKFE